jgi:hypothetical protein
MNWRVYATSTRVQMTHRGAHLDDHRHRQQQNKTGADGNGKQRTERKAGKQGVAHEIQQFIDESRVCSTGDVP